MRLAARGLRERDGDVEAIDDPRERAAVRHQARAVHARAAALAALLAGLAWLA